MNRNALLVVLVVVTAATALLYVGRFAAPDAALYTTLNDRALIVIGGLTKLAALILATIYALRSAALLGSTNPAYAPWRTLGFGLAAFSLGQGTLVYYQVVKGTSPFPSIADLWFIISYPLLIIALVGFAVAYTKSGFPAEGVRAVSIILLIVAAALAWPLLQPIAKTSGEPLATALNLAYPSLDLVLLVPAIVLLWLTSRFRGGVIWRTWAALLLGFVCVAIGDILFAYLSTLGIEKLDPLVHAVYIVAYGAVAAGGMIQHRLLAA